MLYSINRPNFIAWLSLLFEILGNICIAIICFPVCYYINFEINLSRVASILEFQEILEKPLIFEKSPGEGPEKIISPGVLEKCLEKL